MLFAIQNIFHPMYAMQHSFSEFSKESFNRILKCKRVPKNEFGAANNVTPANNNHKMYTFQCDLWLCEFVRERERESGGYWMSVLLKQSVGCSTKIVLIAKKQWRSTKKREKDKDTDRHRKETMRSRKWLWRRVHEC